MRIKIFNDYYLVIEADRVLVLSLKGNKEKIIKPTKRHNSLFYSIFENGIKKEYSIKELVKLAMNSIRC
jgi:hypothetical protein